MSTNDHAARIPLGFMPPGKQACIEEIDTRIDPIQREQLAAYGLAPQRVLTVLQQHPMTIMMIDEVELALEADIARLVWVSLFDASL